MNGSIKSDAIAMCKIEVELDAWYFTDENDEDAKLILDISSTFGDEKDIISFNFADLLKEMMVEHIPSYVSLFSNKRISGYLRSIADDIDK